MRYRVFINDPKDHPMRHVTQHGYAFQGFATNLRDVWSKYYTFNIRYGDTIYPTKYRHEVSAKEIKSADRTKIGTTADGRSVYVSWVNI